MYCVQRQEVKQKALLSSFADFHQKVSNLFQVISSKVVSHKCRFLGRYPIHFHLSGDVSGSYVRGCAIHHTFNRAVTVHGVTGLVVEHNVAYHIKGHAYFIEDGIETGNTIQYNLGVFVQSSSTLLTTDSTPATFWVTNPNNTSKSKAFCWLFLPLTCSAVS